MKKLQQNSWQSIINITAIKKLIDLVCFHYKTAGSTVVFLVVHGWFVVVLYFVFLFMLMCSSCGCAQF